MAFPPSKGKKHRSSPATMPQLTSMMDMMVIMLLFLLKTYASTGHLMKPAEGVQLPTSTVTQEPIKVLSLIVNPDGLFEEMGNNQHRLLEEPVILQDDQNVELNNLSAFLAEIQERNLRLGRQEKKVVTIQGDKAVPYRWLLKVINTCSYAGFEKVDFVVYKESKYRG